MAPTSERLFVDLITLATHKYPNWDPEVPIEPGDYGRITSGHRHKSYAGGGGAGAFWYRNVTLKRRRVSAGTFLKEGNIYREGLAERYGIPLPVEYGGDSTQGTTWITSKNARQVTWDAGIAGQHPSLAECSVKASFKFTTGQGAVLAMDNDTVLAINPAGKLLRLLASESQTGTKKEAHEMENGKEKEKALPEGTVIVSEVHRCSSYARFLSSSFDRHTSVTLGMKVQPTPTVQATLGPDGTPAPIGLPTGWANVEGRWVHDSTAGNFRAKVNKDGKRVFYPLFRLVSLEEESLSTGLRR